MGSERIENLTELEFELLCHFYEHRGRISMKNDLVENVYRQQYNFGEDGLSDEMLQVLISRLRKKIELESQHPVISSPSGAKDTSLLNSSTGAEIHNMNTGSYSQIRGLFRFLRKCPRKTS